MHRVLKYRRKQRESNKGSDSDDVSRQIIELYSASSSTYELAAEFGCHRSTINRTLKKAGIVVSHKASKREGLVEHILELYAGFMRPVDIGKELGVSESTVRRILHENNVRIKHSSEYSKSQDMR